MPNVWLHRGAGLAAVLLCLALVAPAQRLVDHVWQSRGLAHVRPAETVSPVEVLGTMVGGFRGLFLDLVWMRAVRLQEEQQQYYESALLYKMILELEPRFPDVWSYLAWNLAYNISIEYSTPQERWPWVRKGIQALQEGLERNPKSWRLRFELGFLFEHKMRATGLDHHYAEFQRAWLEEQRARPKEYQEFLDRLRDQRGGTLPRDDDELILEYAIFYFHQALDTPGADQRLTLRALAACLTQVPDRWPEAERRWLELSSNPDLSTRPLRVLCHDFLVNELYWADRNARDAREKGQAERADAQAKEFERLRALIGEQFRDHRAPEALFAEWRQRHQTAAEPGVSPSPE